MAFTTRQEYVQQGVEWINKNKEHLIEMLHQALLTQPGTNYKDEPAAYQYEVARNSLEALIKRLEGEIYAVEKIKQQFIVALQHGATAIALTSASDILTELLKSETRKGLKNNPAAVEALTERMDYTNILTKSAIASAQIEFLTQKGLKK
ncbi:MAG TPA: hypothetical protein VH186_31685 [Chloroflexia bacterium]|nr:hypothetical protein [Chloroflexia bacterium]